MVPNLDQQQAGQDRVLALLSGQRTVLMRYMAGSPRVFSIMLWTGLKQLGQRMRTKHIPSKQPPTWRQSPHH